MRRAEFLRLTGLTVNNLKNFARRDCIPFAAGTDEAAAYDYKQAFATRLAIKLGDYIDLRKAKQVVESYLDTFVAEFGADLLDGKQILFGYGHHFGPATDFGGVRPDVGLVSGPIDGLTKSVIVNDDAGHFVRFSLVPLGSQKSRLTGVALIDAGEELAEFRRNAGDHPIATRWIVAREDDAE